MTAAAAQALHQLWSENRTENKLTLFLFVDLLPLEQDAVFGLEALLVLCSQDDSPGAQATLKVTLLLSSPSQLLVIITACVTEIWCAPNLFWWKHNRPEGKDYFSGLSIIRVQSSRETEHSHSTAPLSSRIRGLLQVVGSIPLSGKL